MAKQTVNIGTSANDRTGDNLRSAFSKINANFTELYTQLGLDVDGLNLGAFEFSGSIMTTTDSSAITIDQALTVTSDITTGGDIIPNVNEEHNLGSATRRFKDLYLSSNTIDLGGTTLSVVGGNLQVGGTDIKDVVTAAGVDYSEIQNTPTIPSNLNDLADVNTTSPANGDFLMYANGEWVNAVLLNNIVAGSNVSLLNNDAGYLTSVSFDDLTITPTTLSGYGITDAATSAQGALADTALQSIPASITTNVTGELKTNSISSIYDNNVQQGLLNYDINIATGAGTGAGSDNYASGTIRMSTADVSDIPGRIYFAGGNASGATRTGGLIELEAGGNSTNGVDGAKIRLNGARTTKGSISLYGSSLDLTNVDTVNFTGTTVTGLDVQATGDLTGSVFADDSTLLVDGVNGYLTGWVKTTDVQSLYVRNNADVGPDLLIYANNQVNIQYAEGDILLGNATGTITVNGTVDFTNANVTNLSAPYTPNNGTHWADADPTTISDALDRIAAAIYAVNGGTPI